MRLRSLACCSLLLLLLLLIGAACSTDRETLPPTGQLVIYFTTDAPVPFAPGTVVDENEPPPLFDRLRIELFPPGESNPCPGCTREIAPERELFRSGKASIGFVPRVGVAGYRVRARLFRGFSTGSEPRPKSTIDVTAALPVLAQDEGITSVTVHLATSDVGEPKGTLDEPGAAIAGAPATAPIPLWLPAQRRSCAGAGEEKRDEVCIPGGAFWMGDPHLDDGGDPDTFPGRAERLVVLSPFFLDLTEVLVTDFRAARGLRLLPNDDTDPLLNDERALSSAFCTYAKDEKPKNEGKPVNCITWDGAKAFCEKLGKRLPTVAEHEYVHGALSSRRFVWGSDPPSCDDVVFGRMKQGQCEGDGVFDVHAPGSGKRDRLEIGGPGGKAVLDLSGNLSEWAEDWYQADREECWNQSGVFTDPVCTKPGRLHPKKKTILGANFNAPNVRIPAASRGFILEIDNFVRAADIGFRCARNGR